jgi:hypothetical protein
MGRKKSGARYKRGALAGVIAGAVMALAYILVDVLSKGAAAGTDVAMKDFGFTYFLARIGAGVLIGVFWGLFYAAVEERVWGVGFLKGIVFGAAVWLLGGLPTALNNYLAFEFRGLTGLWAFGGLGVCILGGVAVSLVYGRVGYDDSRREPVKVTATITGGGTAPEPPDRDMLPPGGGDEEP